MFWDGNDFIFRLGNDYIFWDRNDFISWVHNDLIFRVRNGVYSSRNSGTFVLEFVLQTFVLEFVPLIIELKPPWLIPSSPSNPTIHSTLPQKSATHLSQAFSLLPVLISERGRVNSTTGRPLSGETRPPGTPVGRLGVPLVHGLLARLEFHIIKKSSERKTRSDYRECFGCWPLMLRTGRVASPCWGISRPSVPVVPVFVQLVLTGWRVFWNSSL